MKSFCFKPFSIGLVALIYFVSGCLVDAIAQAQSYRYKDNEGVLHISSAIPPELVKNGYEVLNDKGRVIKSVLPQAALNEQAARALELAEQRHHIELQQSQDEALLRFYSTPEDIYRVRERKMQEFDNFIQIQSGNISGSKSRIKALQAQAADIERSGYQVNQGIIDNIATLNERVATAERSIELKLIEKEQVNSAYQKDIERLRILLGLDEEEAAEL